MTQEELKALGFDDVTTASDRRAGIRVALMGHRIRIETSYPRGELNPCRVVDLAITAAYEKGQAKVQTEVRAALNIRS